MSNDFFNPKPVEELTFTDDGMFQAVLHQENVCADLIERLLHVKVSRVEYPELEKQIAPFFTTKGVRLDVYLKDEDKVIDIEIQCYRQKALGKRTRYYQSMIDIDSLMKGQPYPQLKESYILFICKDDPFKTGEKDEKGNDKYYGLPCYTFRNTCEENPVVNLDDKSLKVIYNASAYELEKDKRVRDFLSYIVFQYAFDYSDAHRDEILKYGDERNFDKNFKFTDKMFNDILAQAKKKKITGTDEQVAVAREKSAQLFKAYVARDIFGDEAFYKLYEPLDEMLKECLKN